MRWIPVKDRLPQEDWKWYIIDDPEKGVTVATLDEGKFTSSEGWVYNPTGWMPLPPPMEKTLQKESDNS